MTSRIAKIEVLATLNAFLIPEIIERYSEWGRHLASQKEPYWKGISAKPSQQFVVDLSPADIPELAESWGKLDPRAQDFLRRSLGNLNELFQNVQILARLAERLQSQVLQQPSDPASVQE